MGRRDSALLQLVRSTRPEGSERLPHVRPPHGRAATLRGGRMRLVPRLAVPVIMLALVAGCGGSEVAFEEAPGGPAELTVPGDASALAPASATTTPTPTPTEDAAQ